MNSLFRQLNQSEIPYCLFFNSINHQKTTSQFFSAISRLGNGIFWYVLMASLPLIYGNEAWKVILHMMSVATVAYIIYKLLKTKTKRIRPYNYNKEILQNSPVLDQFSFPSGHTMHAFSFATILLHYYSEWSIIIIPFIILVALSRLILGLHYPSDVAMGIFIGYLLATSSLLLL
ncbi:MAG: phosphatase PAP2 family protein [Cocleimonas sp.]|nr:phosphatase PAP2 family protein [Cocleimonas sp.]